MTIPNRRIRVADAEGRLIGNVKNQRATGWRGFGK
jgi:hypothetical protein